MIPQMILFRHFYMLEQMLKFNYKITVHYVFSLCSQNMFFFFIQNAICNIGIVSDLRHRRNRDGKPVISEATGVNYLWHNRLQVAKSYKYE